MAVGSIVLGLVIGALAYVISNIIYFIFIFPLVIGFLAMIAYNILVHRSKIRQSVISALFAFLFGLSITAGFYGTPYLSFRHKVITGYQENYHIDSRTASIGFDQILKDVTGSSGFLGYMKLRATSGDVYSSYLIVNSLPIQSFSFSLKDTGSWVNWLVETVLFIVPSVLIGYREGKIPFNESANNWYDGPLTQIGSIHLQDKENLNSSLQNNDLSGLGQLIVPEGSLKHPQIEVYKQASKVKKGPILLSIKLSRRVSETRVRRVLLSQWEVPQFEFESLTNILNNKFQNINPSSPAEKTYPD